MKSKVENTVQTVENSNAFMNESHVVRNFTRAKGFLSHHRFQPSVGGPLIWVVDTIETLYPSPGNHHGANHQHLILSKITVEYSQGVPEGLSVSQQIFVAVRFGDNVGLADPVPFVEGEMTRIQGEYIDSSQAYATNDNPGLSVLHFTHHPIGFVEFPVNDNARGQIYS